MKSYVYIPHSFSCFLINKNIYNAVQANIFFIKNLWIFSFKKKNEIFKTLEYKNYNLNSYRSLSTSPREERWSFFFNSG